MTKLYIRIIQETRETCFLLCISGFLRVLDTINFNMAASTKSSFAARETGYQPLSGLIPTVYPESFVILTLSECKD